MVGCCVVAHGHLESKDKLGSVGVRLDADVMLLYLGSDNFGKVDSMDSVSTFLLEEEEIVKLDNMESLGGG